MTSLPTRFVPGQQGPSLSTPHNASRASRPAGSTQLSPRVGKKTNKPRPVCPTCSKTFSKPANLKAHERIHTGEKRYGCDICAKRFVWKSSLNFHARTAHKEPKALDNGAAAPNAAKEEPSPVQVDQSAIVRASLLSPCSSRELSPGSILGSLSAAPKQEEAVVSPPKQIIRPSMPPEDPIAKFEEDVEFCLDNSIVMYQGIKPRSTSEEQGLNLHFFEISAYVSSPLMDVPAPKAPPSPLMDVPAPKAPPSPVMDVPAPKAPPHDYFLD